MNHNILYLQIFSKSMAHGLRFYKNFLPELEGCDDTANFCEWINDLFDALNQNKSSGGVTTGDTAYKVNFILYNCQYKYVAKNKVQKNYK